MKKIQILLFIFLMGLMGCSNLQNLQVNLKGPFEDNEKVTLLLYAYDSRIADKEATLIEKKEVSLKKSENIVEFQIPNKVQGIEGDATYYLSIENKDRFLIDYNTGNPMNLEKVGENEIVLKRNQ